MKITDNRKKPLVKKFEDILVGECFIDDDGDVTIKVLDSVANNTFAVCLRTGDIWFPCDDHELDIVSAMVVIE